MIVSLGFSTPAEFEPEEHAPASPAPVQAVGFATGFVGFDDSPAAPPAPAPVQPTAASQAQAVVEAPTSAFIEAAVKEDPVPAATIPKMVAANASRTDIWVNDSSQVSWESVRDYVVSSIEARWGRWPRNPITEASTFKGFVNRWGDKAMAIAEFAVTNGCSWLNAPLSVNRFTKGSDEVFAKVIAEKLDAVAVD
jgi:hypothetical protein